MVNFRQLVESIILLCEGDLSSITPDPKNAQEFLNVYDGFSTIKLLDINDLEFIHQQLTLSHIAGKNWKSAMECFPLFFAIVKAYEGKSSGSKAGEGYTTDAKNHFKTADEFYKNLHQKFKGLKYTKDINRLLNYKVTEYSTQSIKPHPAAFSVYRNAMSQDVYEVLRQDVWPLINKMTITSAVSNIIQTRLSGMERLQLKFAFFPPLNVLKKEGSFDKILEKAIINYNSFIRGQYGYNQDFQTVMQEIDITLKDFATLVHYIREVMSALIGKMGKSNKVNIDKTIKDKTLKFCKEGILEFYTDSGGTEIYTEADPSDPAKTIQIKFTLDKIEELGTEESNKLIEIIKEMSTGVRAKSQAWQKFKEERFQYLVQAASSIASFAGAKLYG
jgi:hypothetical protein